MYQKITFSCFTVLLKGGVTKLEALQLVFCDEIKHPQTVTFLLQINIAGHWH